ncbi:prepilin-type N-terminal cleavage/methylation domain-containing protein [Candidatus Fermentibacteria bacterium]|nr:prepilin-type N-terminal cleavage/methylation domain-containing protein [Candidatus Fermentibacteria bacterium]
MPHVGFRRNRAFSLVEVMVAMVLLLIGVLAVVAQWPMGARLGFMSEWQTEASTIAERTLETIDAGPYPPTSGTATEGRYQITWTISRGPIINTKYAHVVVQWPWQGRMYAVRMGSIIAAAL